MITLFYAGLCCLLVVFLGARVAAWRNKHKIGLGDGGDKELIKRMRAHGNATENLPLLLIMVAGLELTGYRDLWIHIFGAAIFLSRCAHAWGVSHRSGYSIGRFAGMFVTWSLMGVMSIIAIWGFVSTQFA
jgi:uncharacterized protein